MTKKYWQVANTMGSPKIGRILPHDSTATCGAYESPHREVGRSSAGAAGAAGAIYRPILGHSHNMPRGMTSDV